MIAKYNTSLVIVYGMCIYANLTTHYTTIVLVITQHAGEIKYE